MLTTTDPLNHTTTIAYNAFGQTASVTDPLGNRSQRLYDAASRLTALIDPRGKTTQFTYDPVNQVTQIADAINGLTGFIYDPNGNLLTVAEAKSQTTTYVYDNMDRLQTRTDALNRSERYQYDLVGNLTRFTDRKNQQTNFVYDPLNRRTSSSYADGTGTNFTYDTVGRLVKASDSASGAGTIEFGYDILNRLIQETTEQGTVTYQYDILGRRTQMAANGQQPTSYQYDAASRLTRVAQGSLFAALGYDNANRRASLSYSNGTTTSYAYDLATRLTNITHNGSSGVIDALTYTYDAAGNRFSADRTNGTASLLPSAVASATYDAANEQTAFAGATLTYDANGNLMNDGVNTYQWDARNRLISMSGGATANFVYDPLGRRASKTINGASTQFAYDGNDIAAEIGGGTVGANYLRSLNIDEPFIRQTGTGNEHYHTDALGSLLALSDATGGSVATYGYEPFGKTTVTGSSSNVLQYTGRENDGTGLYYYRNRYAMPKTHRFMNEDPLRYAGGDLNVFAYVWNSPIQLRDPLGLLGIGGTAGISGGSGNGLVGIAGTASVGAGLFGGGDQGLNVGSFSSVGAFAGGPLGSIGYPSPDPNVPNWVVGGFGGIGIGPYITNATSAADLKYTAGTASYDIGVPGINFSLQYGDGYDPKGNYIWQLSITAGPGAGIGRSSMSTETQVLSHIPLPLGKRK
ncbi:Rhs family protein (fragment) [Nitrospira lenta]|uniref:Rhs family protein n=1 Tax=Nitrospira lenta TaxID=1436998 RepID=A0A330L0L6_9BACT